MDVKLRRLAMALATTGLAVTSLAGCATGDGTVGGVGDTAVVGEKPSEGREKPSHEDVAGKAEAATDTAEAGGIWVVTTAHRVSDWDTDGDGTSDASMTDDMKFEFDDAGNLIRIHNVAEEGNATDTGFDTNLEYDSDGFLTRIVAGTAVGETALTYKTELDDQGRPSTVTATQDAGGELVYEFAYDDEGHLVSLGGDGKTVMFDEAGNVTKVADYVTCTYEYDGDGHPTKVIYEVKGDAESEGTRSESLMECQYDENGNIVSLSQTDADGTASHTTYEYAYIENPSKGARLYTHGIRTLMEFIA